MYDILSMSIEELTDIITKNGEAPFRAKQIFSWLHKNNVVSFDEMTNLSIKTREKLNGIFHINGAKVKKTQKSLKDNTQKYLLQLEKNTIIECVLMEYEYGSTACISSQDGCKMGCSFCASQIGKFNRNLTAGEMLSQVYELKRHSKKSVSRCVIMGQGEPFDNYDNTIQFIKLINSPLGYEMGARHITVSTCGVVPKIKEFAHLSVQANLAVSLHAPNESIRKKIMKAANVYDYDSLLNACIYYVEKTNRRITFEYALMKDVNDKAEHAEMLANRLHGIMCHVNLITFNESQGLPYKKSANADTFAAILRKKGVNATIRRTLGADIDGACGQLKNKTAQHCKAT